MEQRTATSPDQLPHLGTDELRRRFLVEGVFVPGEVTAVYTHHDRIVLGGAFPAGRELAMPTFEELRSEFFLANRELGIINVGSAGTVKVDGKVHELPHGACLYVGRDNRDITFMDLAEDAATSASGAQFYLFSAPAHATFPPSWSCRAMERSASSVTRPPAIGERLTSTSTRTASSPARSSWGSPGSTRVRCGTRCRRTPTTGARSVTCTSTFRPRRG